MVAEGIHSAINGTVSAILVLGEHAKHAVTGSLRRQYGNDSAAIVECMRTVGCPGGPEFYRFVSAGIVNC